MAGKRAVQKLPWLPTGQQERGLTPAPPIFDIALFFIFIAGPRGCLWAWAFRAPTGGFGVLLEPEKWLNGPLGAGGPR
jgi:hypothetical protein